MKSATNTKALRALTTASPVPSRRYRFLTRLLILAVVVGLICVFRAPILRAAAAAWIIDTPPASAAAIIVLGGGRDTRPFAAAKLYHDGYSPKILIPRVQPGPTEQLGLARNDSEIIHDILVKQGVPETALEYIGTKVSSTYEESLAVKSWLTSQATASSPATILIPTELFYTRRTRWIFQRNLGSIAQPVVISIPAREYTADNWWTTEDGLIAFQNEVIKTAFYHWKY